MHGYLGDASGLSIPAEWSLGYIRIFHRIRLMQYADVTNRKCMQLAHGYLRHSQEHYIS